MSNKIDKFISTGTIHVCEFELETSRIVQLTTVKPNPNQLDSEKPQTKYSVDFSPDPDHTFTDKLKRKYALFLNQKSSACDCKKSEVTLICKCKRPEVSSIVQPLEIGIVKLCVKDENWEVKNWGNILSNCAIAQTKIDVFVNEDLILIGFRIPAIQSLD